MRARIAGQSFGSRDAAWTPPSRSQDPPTRCPAHTGDFLHTSQVRDRRERGLAQGVGRPNASCPQPRFIHDGSATPGRSTSTWIPGCRPGLVKGRPLTPATRIGYQRLYRRNIRARLGGRQLRTLRPETIRTWHADVTAAAGADQAAKSYRFLRAVLATAETDELIRQNRVASAAVIRRTQPSGRWCRLHWSLSWPRPSAPVIAA